MNLSRRSLLSGAAAIIGATVIGGAIKVAPTITFVEAKNAAEFKVGESIMIGSIDQQLVGYPEDYLGTLRAVYYHRVEWIDQTTGLIQFSRWPVYE